MNVIKSCLRVRPIHSIGCLVSKYAVIVVAKAVSVSTIKHTTEIRKGIKHILQDNENPSHSPNHISIKLFSNSTNSSKR